MAAQNYTLGRGKLFFSRFLPGTKTPAGFGYVGNTPEFSLTIDPQMLEHYSSDEGIREKDDSMVLEIARSASWTTDDIQQSNLSVFFLGDEETYGQTLVASHMETLSDVLAGKTYKLGATEANPVGYMGINPAGVSVVTGGDTLVGGGVDYTLDAAEPWWTATTFKSRSQFARPRATGSCLALLRSRVR